MEDSFNNKLEYSKVLMKNKKALDTTEFQSILLYCKADDVMKPMERCEEIGQFGLKGTLLDYHFDMLFKSNLFDVHIVTYKSVAKEIMTYDLPKDMISKMNIKIHVLSEPEEPATALKFILKDMTKDFIAIHGQYFCDITLGNALACHKINEPDMTLVLQKVQDLEHNCIYSSSSSMSKGVAIYGLGENQECKDLLPVLRQAKPLYAMFNSFEAADVNGLAVKKSILKKCPHSSINLRSDLLDTGVYFFKHWIVNLLKDDELCLETIDFDLVKLLANNQFKTKLYKYKIMDQLDSSTKEIDDLLAEELGESGGVFLQTVIKTDPNEKSVDSSFILEALHKDDDQNLESKLSNVSGDSDSELSL